MTISISEVKDLRDGLLAALADPTRSQIVEMLAERPHTAGEIHRSFAIAAPAVSRHLRVLRDAGLVEERTPPDDRRVRVYTLRAQPVEDLAAWLTGMSRAWQSQLDSFKEYLAVRKEQPRARR